MAENLGFELDWDAEISEENSYTLLDEGDYDFTVINFERGRHTGSAKLPPCAKAILTIAITDNNGKKLAELTHSLFLHSAVEGMLSAFFLAIGAKKHGEPLKMNWNSVPGSSGKCHVYIDEWTNDKGETRKNNKIKYFIDPAKVNDTKTDKPASGQQAISGWAAAGNRWAAK